VFFNGLFEVPYYRINSPESPGWKMFRESLQNGCRAIPIAWNIAEGKGFVKVSKLQTKLSVTWTTDKKGEP